MQVELNYSELTILFSSVKKKREELNSKTYANDALMKTTEDKEKREHLLDLQDQYYTAKGKVDNLYYKLEETINSVR